MGARGGGILEPKCSQSNSPCQELGIWTGSGSQQEQDDTLNRTSEEPHKGTTHEGMCGVKGTVRHSGAGERGKPPTGGSF
jgi:hypothetical protein